MKSEEGNSGICAPSPYSQHTSFSSFWVYKDLPLPLPRGAEPENLPPESARGMVLQRSEAGRFELRQTWVTQHRNPFDFYIFLEIQENESQLAKCLHIFIGRNGTVERTCDRRPESQFFLYYSMALRPSANNLISLGLSVFQM